MPDVAEEMEEDLDSWVIVVRVTIFFYLIVQLQVRVRDCGNFS